MVAALGARSPAVQFVLRWPMPEALARGPGADRAMYWGWVVELATKAKVRDLLRGLDRDGKPLQPIRPKTRKYRKSEMMPRGKGDPLAPPLIPGWKKSRTISLFAGRAYADHATFFWRYDAWTGDTWGKVLGYQREQGRDVIGLPAKTITRIRRTVDRRYAEWLEGKRFAGARLARPADHPPLATPQGLKYTTFGMGASAPVPGMVKPMTRDEWAEHFRAPAKAAVPHRSADANRLLAHVWGVPPPTPPAKPTSPPTPPTSPAKPTAKGWSGQARRQSLVVRWLDALAGLWPLRRRP